MIVYKVTNKIDNKIYIGQTTRTLEKRKKEHLRDNRGRHFSSALIKYGEDNFIWEILEICNNISEMNLKEKYYISLYKSSSRECGYNLSIGGEYAPITEETREKLKKSSTGIHRKHTEESKLKMSEIKKGIIFSEERKMNISKGQMGKKLSDETKLKISESHKGLKMSEDTKIKMSQSRLGHKMSKESIEKRTKSRKEMKIKRLEESYSIPQ